MPSPSVTYSFTNGTTADASQVNTNFTDLINALTDGLKDITVAAISGTSITVSGTATFNGNMVFGNASADTITVAGTPTFATAITISATTNQIVLGTTNTLTITSPAQAASRTFTIPLVAGASNFVMTAAGTTDTLLGTITGSSLTSVGTITTGVWNAGAVTSSGAITGTGFIPTGSTAPTNGLYLAAANNPAISVNSTQAVSWTTTDHVHTVGTNGALRANIQFAADTFPTNKNASYPQISAGTYTPSQVSTNTNISAITFRLCQWIRVGNIVHVSARIDVDPTAATTFTVALFSLPIASSFTSGFELYGVGTMQNSLSTNVVGRCIADAVNDCCEYDFFCLGDAGNNPHYLEFTYTIV